MASPPPAKRRKPSPSGPSMVASPTNSRPELQIAPGQAVPATVPAIAPKAVLDTAPPLAASPTTPTSPTNPRKRRVSRSPKLNTLPPGTSPQQESSTGVAISALLTEDSSGRKKGRTNTPWTAAEEQRLKQMRDTGNSWGEIAKAFPNRTEGSVKKHWYKDMHYAEFAEDESVALREAIKEYEANKWKAIGQKLGKPAKACEQYAREHFKSL